MKTGRGVVYALVDPDQPDVYHYVGQTRKKYVSSRLGAHVYIGQTRQHPMASTPVGLWLANLNAEQKRPLLVVLEHASYRTIDQREAHWIHALFVAGHPLKNRTSGGRMGFTLASSTRALIGAANTGKVRSVETKAKLAAASKGIKNANYGKVGLNNPAFSYRNRRIAEKAKSPEVKTKNSAALKALWADPAWRTNMLKARKQGNNQ